MDGDNRQRVVNTGLEFQSPGQTNKWQVPTQTQAQAQAKPQPEMSRAHLPTQIQLEVARAQKKARTHLTRQCGYPLPLKPLQPLQPHKPHVAQVSKVPDFLFPTHQPILFFRPDPRPQFNFPTVLPQHSPRQLQQTHTVTSSRIRQPTPPRNPRHSLSLEIASPTHLLLFPPSFILHLQPLAVHPQPPTFRSNSPPTTVRSPRASSSTVTRAP